MDPIIPVVLYAYARPDHLRRTLKCLRDNNIPLLYAFSDGPKAPEMVGRVNEVRKNLREIDWCEVRLVERTENLGLGKSILTGVAKVFKKHEAIIVFEDDLICVPGTYQYLCAAMEHYKDNPQVMSVTGWTHPLVTPSDITDQLYFDGRAECWVWGTWSRAWKGMDQDAKTLMLACEARGIDRNQYGADLPLMAENELRQNIWAVRFLYHHILNRGLCLRPPWSMVEHIGFDAQATNAVSAGQWATLPLRPCPPLPVEWPEPVENTECPALYQQAFGGNPSTTPPSIARRIKRILRKTAVQLTGSKRFEAMRPMDFIKLLTPPILIHGYHALRSGTKNGSSTNDDNHQGNGLRLTGDYSSWHAAMADCTGYDVDVILEKTTESLLKVKNGEAVYERDSVLFDEIQYSWPMLVGLMWAAARRGGRLNVLDFGGSLGSTYFQNRTFFDDLNEIRWNIVEQARHVDVGKKWFENDQLKFYASIEECLAATHPRVILLGSVLQYLPEPYEIFDQLLTLPCDLLIIDRTPFWAGSTDQLCIQHVPIEIYPASYPSWIFSKERLHSHLNANWKIVAEFDNPDRIPGPVEFSYRGIIATRRKPTVAER